LRWSPGWWQGRMAALGLANGSVWGSAAICGPRGAWAWSRFARPCSCPRAGPSGPWSTAGANRPGPICAAARLVPFVAAHSPRRAVCSRYEEKPANTRGRSWVLCAIWPLGGLVTGKKGGCHGPGRGGRGAWDDSGGGNAHHRRGPLLALLRATGPTSWVPPRPPTITWTGADHLRRKGARINGRAAAVPRTGAGPAEGVAQGYAKKARGKRGSGSGTTARIGGGVLRRGDAARYGPWKLPWRRFIPRWTTEGSIVMLDFSWGGFRTFWCALGPQAWAARSEAMHRARAAAGRQCWAGRGVRHWWWPLPENSVPDPPRVRRCASIRCFRRELRVCTTPPHPPPPPHPHGRGPGTAVRDSR